MRFAKADRSRRIPLLLATVMAVALLPTAAARAGDELGDRQLIRTTSADPYLMILFDTSSSMNWASTCSQTDINNGKCDFLCANQNCPVPRAGDDPDSKLYQAKEALHTVIEDFSHIYYGMATLNQDTLAVGAKHWLYTIQEVDDLPNGFPGVPAVGSQVVFGPITGSAPAFDYRCDRWNPSANDVGSTYADYEDGCYGNTTDAADTSDAWSVSKIGRLPRGGTDGSTSLTYYLRATTGSGASKVTTLYRYRENVGKSAFPYASTDAFDSDFYVSSCTTVVSGDCTVWGTETKAKIKYSRQDANGNAQNTSFLFWEGSLRRNRNATDHTREAFLGGRADAADPAACTVANQASCTASDAYTTESCRGWEPSGAYPSIGNPLLPPGESDNDPYSSYDLHQTTNPTLTFDPTGTQYDWLFQYGDVIPLDWNNDNKDAVLDRLSPGGAGNYGQAPFFADSYAGSESFLRLNDDSQKPLIGAGSTPLAGWFSFFRFWYTGCGDTGKCTETGWSDFAAANDPDFNCRNKYLLILTDGGETCDNDPQEPGTNYYDSDVTKFPEGFDTGAAGAQADQCSYRTALRNLEDITTYVIGFGTENQAKLQCTRGNQNVFFVYNKADLVAVLNQIFGQIQEQAAAFASAAVPTVQANIIDKIYLSSFIPLNDEAVWPGRLDSFLKPLPLDPVTGLPDRTTVCDPFSANPRQSECFAWDGGDSQAAFYGEAGYNPQGLLLQAPLSSLITRYNNATLKIGLDADERRVLFGVPGSSLLGQRQYFEYPADNAEQANFEYAWNLANAGIGDATNKSTIADVIEFTLEHKQGLIDNAVDPANPFHIEYVMGDIFHSNPVVVNPPADFDLFTKDPYWNKLLCGATDLDQMRIDRGPQISYSYFSNKNICRRVITFAGSDDGQLHAFDSGQIQDLPDDPDDTIAPSDIDCLLNVPSNSSSFVAGLKDDDGLGGGYDYGSGRELFSFIPNAMMPEVKGLSEVSELTTEYGVDGTVRVADVFVDPVLSSGVATCTDRQWRSVLLGTYREGGPGIFALDITQPDVIDSSTNVPASIGGRTDYVPSCTEAPGSNTTPSDCGPLPFPALKWEFQDHDINDQPADDDGDLQTDLADGWSRPVVARLSVCTANCGLADKELEDRWVAIFGGGLPELPENDATDTGNWLYMVDIETGKLLYKRGGSGANAVGGNAIAGAVPSDITAVDTDNDGYIDRLYFGTTAGFVYKVNLGNGPFELDADGRIKDPTGADGKYSPFQVFTTGGKPIYLEVNAVWVPRRDAYALLFGTGYRKNLWRFTGDVGEFYVILDQGWTDDDGSGTFDGIMQPACVGCPQPLNQSKYTSVDEDDTAAVTNYLFDGGGGTTLPGWYLIANADDKLITESFSLSGVTIFTFFAPTSTENNDGTCSRGGESKIFIVNTVSSKGYAVNAGSTARSRYLLAPTFTTQPYVESSATKNVASTSVNNADSWADNLKEINADLRKLFPVGARFANYTLDIKTVRSDTGIYFIAPVPVAIQAHDWKEF